MAEPLTDDLRVDARQQGQRGNGTNAGNAPTILALDRASLSWTGTPPAGWAAAARTYDLSTAPASADQLAIAATWSTFWDGEVPSKAKATLVQGGADPIDLDHLFGPVLPRSFRAQISAVAVHGSTGTVTWTSVPAGTRPQTDPVVRVGGQWKLTSTQWQHLLGTIRGSG